MEDKFVTLNMERIDVGQMLDALESRAEAYEGTSRVLRGEDSGMEYFVIEEVNDYSEADNIAEHFRNIIAKIEKQVKNQKSISEQ